MNKYKFISSKEELLEEWNKKQKQEFPENPLVYNDFENFYRVSRNVAHSSGKQEVHTEYSDQQLANFMEFWKQVKTLKKRKRKAKKIWENMKKSIAGGL